MKKAKKSQMFCIVINKNTGEPYVCPVEKSDDAYEYFEFVSTPEAEKFDGVEPEWLIPVIEVHSVHFTNFEIDNN